MSHIAFVGPLRDPSGHADEARGFLRALDAAGHAPGAIEMTWTDKLAGLSDVEDARLRRHVARGADGPGVAIHHYLPAPGQPSVEGRVNVARAMFETDRMPASWLAPLLERDEVWVPSAFNRETFRRSGLPDSRIRVIGGTLDFDLFAPGAPPLHLGVEPGRQVFLSNFDFSERKGWRQLLEAWAAAFSADDPVALVMKVGSFYRDDAHVQGRIQVVLDELEHRHGRETAPIVLFDQMLTARQMPMLYAAADAYVLPSRGEGWGRPFMEALAMGLPTVAGDFSAVQEFMDPESSWLVDGRLVDVADDAELFNSLYAGHRWFEADVEHLTATLREIAADPQAARDRAAAARPQLLERFGPEATAQRLTDAAADALDLHAGRQARAPLCVVRGRFGAGDSLRVVNDGIAESLEARGHHVVRRAPGATEPLCSAPSISHGWPVELDAGTAGPAVAILPWEYGDPPREWVTAARTRLDRVVVYSHYIRDGYVAAGMPPGIVEVVPCGVDLDTYTPEGAAATLPGDAACTFLFVGGTIARKGIDLLLDGWKQAFGPGDDVRLVIKDFGAGTHYDTAADLVARYAADAGCAPIVHIEDHLEREDIAALYRAADVVVLPYRGEGFCLPALEALACGRPVVHTGTGPTRDFVPEAAGWALPAERRELAGAIDGGAIELAGPGYWHEIDPAQLAATLRSVAADPAERERRAAAARPAAEARSWERAAADLERVLDTLAAEHLPLARTISPAVLDDARGTVVLHAPDWDDEARWCATLVAWAATVAAGDDVTLVLPVDPEHAPAITATATTALAAAGHDLDALPDLALVPDAAGAAIPGLVARADAVLLDDSQAADPPAVLARRAARLLTSAEVAGYVAGRASASALS